MFPALGVDLIEKYPEIVEVGIPVISANCPCVRCPVYFFKFSDISILIRLSNNESGCLGIIYPSVLYIAIITNKIIKIKILYIHKTINDV